MSKKTKITDADIIDVIINDRMDQLKQQREGVEAKLEQLQKRYKKVLYNLIFTSTRGQALLRAFPEAEATSLHIYRGNRVNVSFNRHTCVSNSDDELSAEIVVKQSVVKHALKIKSDIDNLQSKLLELRTPERIAWKRSILREALAEQPAALASFRAAINAAIKAAYKAIPEHRHRQLAIATGVPQPKKPTSSRKGRPVGVPRRRR